MFNSKYIYIEKNNNLNIYESASLLPPSADDTKGIIVEYIPNASSLITDEISELPLTDDQWYAVLAYIKAKLYEDIDPRMSVFHSKKVNKAVADANRRMGHKGKGEKYHDVVNVNMKKRLR